MARSDLRRALNREMTEANWQQLVVEAAQLYGWLVMHTRPARTSKGWRTPIQGDPGFPDVVAVHPDYGVILFVELKAERGRLSNHQRRWIDGLVEAENRGFTAVYVAVWRPSDWPRVREVLEHGPPGVET